MTSSLPGKHVALYQVCAVEGNFDTVRRIMSGMMSLMRLPEQGGRLVQCVKHDTTLAGNEVGAMMRPFKPLNKDDKRAVGQGVRVLTAASFNI